MVCGRESSPYSRVRLPFFILSKIAGDWHSRGEADPGGYIFFELTPRGKQMSKLTKTFQIAIMDYSDKSITILERVLPSDIQTEELEEILTIEGIYKQTECSLMFGDTITLKGAKNA